MVNITHLFPGGFNPSHYIRDEPVYSDPINEFLNAAHDSGLLIESVIPDGQIHSVKHKDDNPRNPSGWYVYFSDHIPAGSFGNHRYGQKTPWRHNVGRELTQEELAYQSKRMDEIRKRREADLKLYQDRRAIDALKIWESAQPADPNHSYLTNKLISPHGIRQLPDNRLIIPIQNIEGEIRSIQFIYPEKINGRDKLYLKGGEKKGNYYSIGALTDVIYICEGFSTGATIHEATGCMVIATFDSSNIKPVAINIRGRYPDKRIIITADNDQYPNKKGEIKNAGVIVATDAANMINAGVMYPEFDDLASKPTDFNDLKQLCGMDEVKRQLGKTDPLAMPMAFFANNEIKPIEWVLDGVLTRGTPAMIFAPGGAGKSLLVQHLASCVATGKDFFDKKVLEGPVLSVYCEDDMDEMHRRQSSICEMHYIKYKDLTNLHVISRVGFTNNFLLTFDSKNIGTPTDFYHQLVAEIERIKPVLVTLDTSGDVFPGNENDKAQVNQLLKGIIGSLADKYNCSILLTGHTPKSGAEFAGHMAWENSVRHRIYIDHDRVTGTRLVRLSKTNRGKEGDLWSLYWNNGCLCEMVNASFATRQIDYMLQVEVIRFVELMHERKQNISMSIQATNYAPKVMTKVNSHKKSKFQIEQIETKFNELLDQKTLVITDGHMRNGGKTLTINEVKNEENEQ